MGTQHFLLSCSIQLDIKFKSSTQQVNYFTLNCTSYDCTQHVAEYKERLRFCKYWP